MIIMVNIARSTNAHASQKIVKNILFHNFMKQIKLIILLDLFFKKQIF